MPVGRKLAYDVDRGRLWIVCPKCGEWNLTPLEERWEAIEECERIVATAPARASSANVALSRASGIELIRIGPALRDELANWRYGPRFARRRRRARIVSATAGAVFVGGVGAVALMGMLTAGPAMALWAAAFGFVWLFETGSSVSRNLGPDRDVRVVDTSGRSHRFPSAMLGEVTLVRERHREAKPAVGVWLPVSDKPVTLRRIDALLALGTMLPRLNWSGAQPRTIQRATALLDEAEARVADTSRSVRIAGTAWEVIAISNWPAEGALALAGSIPLLALEMAVSEELERQAMVGEASVLGTRWLEAETVAAIADDMFLPESIRQWIDAHRGARSAGSA